MKTSTLFDHLLTATSDREKCRGRINSWTNTSDDRYSRKHIEAKLSYWRQRYWQRDRLAAKLEMRIRREIKGYEENK